MRIGLDPVEEMWFVLRADAEGLPDAEAAVLLALAYAVRHMPNGWRPEDEAEPIPATNTPNGGRNGPRFPQRDADKAAKMAALAKVYVQNPHASAAELGRAAGISPRHARRLLAEMR
jgi:hypothetical protein